MIERKDSEQAPDMGMGTPGTYLKGEDKDTDVDASEIEDKSDGMQEKDFLGRSNLENRDKESPEDK